MAKVTMLPVVHVTARRGQESVFNSPPFTDGVFVGREREMAALHTAFDEAVAGRGRLALLVGEPGIGKTRTAHELAAHARVQGARVFSGRCYEGEGAPPFWPWVQIVRAYLHDCDLDTLRADLGAGAADIAQVIPEVRARLPQLPMSPTLESEHARFRFFDSLTTFLTNVAHARPLVLILDDLHWADTSSLLFLRFLARELGDARLLILGAYRDVALDLHHPLRQTLGELAREQGSQTILLRGLTEQAVACFIQNTPGLSPSESLIAAVHQQTEGNPFFLTEVVRLLTSEGQQPQIPAPQSVSTLSIPQRVYDVISRRLAALSEICLRVLTVASVIGREFALEVLTRASDLSRTQILQALEEAIVARVIMDDRQTIGSYSFSHALIRETLYGELTLTQRVASHRHVGEALESLSNADLEPPLTELAYHFFIAAQSGADVEKALDYATQTGARATTLLAYEEATKHYQSALCLLDLQEPDEAMRCEMLLARNRSGDHEKAQELLSSAFATAQELEMINLQSKVERLRSTIGEREKQTARKEKTEMETGTEREGSPFCDTGHETLDVDFHPWGCSLFRREGEYWTIAYRETSFRLGHTRGLDYIAQLLRRPHVEFHVLDLVTCAQKTTSSTAPPHGVVHVEASTPVAQVGCADALLDAQARAAYKQRLMELQEELEEAQSFNDLGRAGAA